MLVAAGEQKKMQPVMRTHLKSSNKESSHAPVDKMVVLLLAQFLTHVHEDVVVLANQSCNMIS